MIAYFIAGNIVTLIFSVFRDNNAAEVVFRFIFTNIFGIVMWIILKHLRVVH